MTSKRPTYIDIHSHVNDTRYDGDRRHTFEQMMKNDVWTVTVGTDLRMSQKACEAALIQEGIFATIGVHPTDRPNEGFDAGVYAQLLETCQKVVAVGECGLDYFRLQGDERKQKTRQKHLFEEQIDFAVGNELPLMIHTREAHKDTLDILKLKQKAYGDKLWGNIHFFSGDRDTAGKYYDLNFTTSITGVITFTTDYDDFMRSAPLSMIMSETDAPYVAPVPHRGKRNEPAYVTHVVDRIIELRKEDAETVKKALVDNAFRVFRFEKHL